MRQTKMYRVDIESILAQNCDWLGFKGKTFLITGATGLVGTVLVDMLVFLNDEFSLGIKLILVSRHERRSKLSFVRYIAHDIASPLEVDEKVDFIVHAASNTHPLQYSRFPIETAATNIFGTYNLLALAAKNQGSRFLFVSSVEIYGDDIHGHESGFSENDVGHLDCNNPRSCYNESKRMGETLCAAFLAEKKVDYVTARVCRCYGPTLKGDDSKAMSQFLRNAVEGKNIVLKSEGNQFYSYVYSADAASALLFLLLKGGTGEPYNIADKTSDTKLRDLASIVAECAGVAVVFDLPDETEAGGYSKATKAVLDTGKIHALGWKANFSLTDGIRRTIQIMREIKKTEK